LRKAYPKKTPSLKLADVQLKVEYSLGAVEVVGGVLNGKRYAIPVVGKAAQELVVEGGLESWVIKRISSSK
jgi:hypothetical protein